MTSPTIGRMWAVPNHRISDSPYCGGIATVTPEGPIAERT